MLTNVQILYSDDSIVAAYKPAGIPVHPTGQFHFNSMTKILEFEHDLANLQRTSRERPWGNGTMEEATCQGAEE